MSSAESCVAEAKKEMEECGVGRVSTSTRPKVKHYQQGEIEPIDFIMSQKLNFNLGNVIKYVTRAGKKEGESKVKDLKKVIDYINFELEGE